MLRNSPNCSNLLILGDFNVDLLSDTPSGSELGFRDEINTHPLIPLVNIPTRVCPTSATCIDHIYTNSFSPFVSGVLADPLADHFPIFCAVPLIGRRDSDKISIKFRDLGWNSIESFRDDLSLSLANFIAFDSFSVEDRFEIFSNILMKSYNSKCPIKHKNISVKRFNSPWLSDSILNSIKEKHRLYRLSLTNPSQLPIYRRYRNILTDTIRKAKATYYQAKFRFCTSDGRATWKVINSVLPTKKYGPD